MIILVPRVKTTGESDHAIPMFPPYSENVTRKSFKSLTITIVKELINKITSLPETKQNLVVSQVSVVIYGEDSLGFNCIERKKPIIQTVPWRFDDLSKYI